MTLLMILPLLLVIVYLFYQAMPILSIDFLLKNPMNGMRGGWHLVAVAGNALPGRDLAGRGVPIGVLAAIYLNEYAGENWFTRLINLAVVNLAGVPSIVHALFGLGAFVLFAVWAAPFSAALDPGDHDPAGDHYQHPGSPRCGPMAFREACWNRRSHPLADHPRNCASQLRQRHPHRCHPASFRAPPGETAPIMFTGAVFYKAIPEGTFLPTVYSINAWRCRCICLPSRPRCPTCPKQCHTAPRSCCWVRFLVNVHRHRPAHPPASPEALVGYPERCCNQLRKIEIADLWSAMAKEALNGISLDVYQKEILGIIGPAQSGKTTLLKAINRTIEFVPKPGCTAGEDRRPGCPSTSRMSTNCAARSAWFSRCRWGCRCPSMTMWLSPRARRDSQGAAGRAGRTDVCGKPPCGTK